MTLGMKTKDIIDFTPEDEIVLAVLQSLVESSDG